MVGRTEQFGDATLILGDCLEVMADMESGSVDMMLTDPPYNEVNRETAGLRVIDKGGADSLPVDPAGLVADADRLGALTVYFWCGTEQVSVYRAALVALGYSTRQCIWWKTNPSPMNGQHLWLSALELCVYGKKHGGVFNLKCAHPVWRGPVTREAVHPTQKPDWLMGTLIEASSAPEQTIFDPFMGSGTTGVAALDLGRKFIGIEIEPKYFDIACRRIELAAAQERMDFGERKAQAEQTELL